MFVCLGGSSCSRSLHLNPIGLFPPVPITGIRSVMRLVHCLSFCGVLVSKSALCFAIFCSCSLMYVCLSCRFQLFQKFAFSFRLRSISWLMRLVASLTFSVSAIVSLMFASVAFLLIKSRSVSALSFSAAILACSPAVWASAVSFFNCASTASTYCEKVCHSLLSSKSRSAVIVCVSVELNSLFVVSVAMFSILTNTSSISVVVLVVSAFFFSVSTGIS